ncbi:MAG: hypothetical protein KJP10_06405, partial [Gammaproteobacteria bacterium]|nr:hypothetical protein [Gammaproteobacteria bacterium]
YDVVDQDGALISVTFRSDGTYEAVENSIIVETGFYQANIPAPGVTTLSDGSTGITLMIVMDGEPTVVGETASILLAAATLLTGTPTSPDDLQFNEIGLGSVTLKSTTP